MYPLAPFIKWVGGKRRLLPEIEKRLPVKFNNYHEPFVGGGALLFHLKPKKAFISDLNLELINTYQVIKNNHKQLREYLLLMEYGHSEDFFKKIRVIDKNSPQDHSSLSMNDSKLLRAARFIYLNKAGFNGIYRVNSKGHFNVPSGKKTFVKTHEYPNLKYIAKYLSNNEINIINQSFEEVIHQVQSGDFVYFDPPYDYEKHQNGFDAYQKNGFGTSGQKKLAEVCQKLHHQGIKWMVSNHNTEFIRNLYSDFFISTVKIKRLIGGRGSLRKEVEEVLITNYEI